MHARQIVYQLSVFPVHACLYEYWGGGGTLCVCVLNLYVRVFSTHVYLYTICMPGAH